MFQKAGTFLLGAQADVYLLMLKTKNFVTIFIQQSIGRIIMLAAEIRRKTVDLMHEFIYL